jgi:hypothetical protein
MTTVVTLLVYTLSASPWIQGGDNAEFALLYAVGGVAHPSGYPLYTLYLQSMSWLPLSSPAHGAAVSTAVLGAGACTLLAVACIRWGVRPWVAALVATLFAFSRLMWEMSTQAEVFALHALLAAAILAVTPAGGPVRGSRRAVLLGVLAGAGLANNLTLVLLAPTGLWGVVRAGREQRSQLSAFALALLSCLVTSGVLYALLPLWAQNGGWVWGDLSTLDGVWRHARRTDFGTFSFGIYGDERHTMEHLWLLARHSMVALLVVGPLVSVAGLVLWGTNRIPGMSRRMDAVMLTWSLVLSGPVLVGLMNLAPEGIALRVIERFYLLPTMILCLGMAGTLEWLAMRRQLTNVHGWPAVVVVGYLQLASSLQSVTDHHDRVVHDYLRNTLNQLPADAVLLGTGDHRLFGYLYLQRALGLRRDVLVLDVNMIRYPWYVRDQCPEDELVWSALTWDGRSTVASNVDTVGLISDLSSSGRPVFLTDVYSRAVGERVPMVPDGALMQVLGPQTPPRSLPEVERANIERLNDYGLSFERRPMRDTWAALVYQDYARPFEQLAAHYGRVGDEARTQRMQEILQRFAPALPVSPWEE